jgi:hypothetical protein
MHIFVTYDFVEQGKMGQDTSKDENAEKIRGAGLGKSSESLSALLGASSARRECNAHEHV